ncbi:MAG: Gfo/Idh/MocA family oxidoreductase [Anaerolineae bacterium]|nr:Gfo/Idh/MocA family oxidoreductase [Anaerolineae bacterium]
MSKKLRVGILGMSHDHLWGNLRALVNSERGELVAAADPNPPLLEKVQQEYQCPQVYATYDELLARDDLDAVYIFADNATGAALAAQAAARGLHVLTEKPMSATLAQANQMLAAARTAGVQLMVNWPTAWGAAFAHAMTLAQRGEIGRIYQTHYRSAHAGPKEVGCSTYFYNWLYDPKLNGAGALMDYCCYGAALAAYLLGLPSRVTGVAGRLVKEYMTVDDNAVLLMEYPHAISVTMASWTQIGHLTSYVPTIYGSEGTLVVERKRLLLADRQHPDGQEVPVPELGADERNATEYFLSRIADGRPIEGLCSPTVGRDAQEILEAGLLSAQRGQAISLPLPLS